MHMTSIKGFTYCLRLLTDQSGLGPAVSGKEWECLLHPGTFRGSRNVLLFILRPFSSLIVVVRIAVNDFDRCVWHKFLLVLCPLRITVSSDHICLPMVVAVAEEFVFGLQLITQLIFDVDSDDAPIRGGSLDLEEELEKPPCRGARSILHWLWYHLTLLVDHIG